MAAHPAPDPRADLMARLQLRDLQPEDLPQAAHIEQSVYEFPWTLGNFRDSHASGYSCRGLFMGERLLAYAIVMYALDEAHLLNIAVAADAQGQGIGRRLLQTVLREAGERQCAMLYLEVRPSNSVARRLYQSFGFRQIAIRPGYYPARHKREDALFLGVLLT